MAEIEKKTLIKIAALIFLPLIGVLVSCLIAETGHPFFFVYFLIFFTITYVLFFSYLLNKKLFHLVLICFSLFFISMIISSSFKAEVSDKDPNNDWLRSLPYLNWVSAEKNFDKKGVTVFDSEKSYKGINIFCYKALEKAFLMDMSGNILHTWSKKIGENDSWQHVELCSNGDLLVIVNEKMILRLDWKSNIKWKRSMNYHHDIDVAENGDIFVLNNEKEAGFSVGMLFPVINDYIEILTPDGQTKKRISFQKLFKGSRIEKRIQFVIFRSFIVGKPIALDVFHTNTIEIIDRDIKRICKKGDLLVSVRNMDLICIVDPESEEVIWNWGHETLSRQHHPSILEDNSILVFDNGVSRNYSRILQIDPYSKKIVWGYRSDPPSEFFSAIRGGTQRLPNGNTLITESNKARVFEIDKSGEIVWEFYGTEFNEKKKERSAIYRMMRITDIENYPILKDLM